MTNLNFKFFNSNTIVAIFLFILLFYVTLSIHLRPIADDYCVAVGAASGFFDHFQNVISNWSGDYTQIVLSYVLVASPIAFGPTFLVGLTTLLFSVFLLLLVMARALQIVLPEISSEKDKKLLCGLSALLLVCWFIYWALPASINTYGRYKSFLSASESFSSVFGWPTVIVQYLVVPLLLIVLAAQLQRNNPILTIFHGALGFLIGTSGYALALTVFATTTILILIKTVNFKPLRFALLQVGIFVGVFLSFFSKGSLNRATQFLDSESNKSFVSLSRSAFVSFVEFLVSIVNLGTFTLFLIVFTFVTLIIQGRVTLVLSPIRSKFILSFSIFLMFYYLAISVSEYFVYPAYWHLITFKTLLFVYIVLLSIIFADRCQRITSMIGVSGRRGWIALGCVILMALGASAPSYKSVLVRGNLWVEQSAQLPGISDISPRGGWVDLCWQTLREFRGWEDRQYDRH